MSKTIILISSRLPRMGKDTVGSYLNIRYGYERIAFADRVKEIATNCFGWDGEKDAKGRQLLIDIGTHTARKYNPTLWIDYVAKKISESKHDKFVITDCRFINEYERIKNSPFLTEDTRVFSIGLTSIKYGDKTYENDPSQIEFKDIHKDFLLENNSTIKDLQEKIDTIMLFHVGGYNNV